MEITVVVRWNPSMPFVVWSVGSECLPQPRKNARQVKQGL